MSHGRRTKDNDTYSRSSNKTTTIIDYDLTSSSLTSSVISDGGEPAGLVYTVMHLGVLDSCHRQIARIPRYLNFLKMAPA